MTKLSNQQMVARMLSKIYRLWVLFKWTVLDWQGQYCEQCGFHEATHYDHSLEFDMESYPCDHFRNEYSGGEK